MEKSTDSLSDAILAAVADREGVEEGELATPLYTAIDTEALDVLFRDSSGEVTFEYLDYEVTVDDEGNVDLAPMDAD